MSSEERIALYGAVWGSWRVRGDLVRNVRRHRVGISFRDRVRGLDRAPGIRYNVSPKA